jgi:very-short-patch-repair endonuclease
MRPRQTEDEIDRLGRARHGVFSLDDLFAMGLTREAIGRRVRSGRLIRVYEGVFRTPGSPATWEQGLWAALAWARGDCVFSHRSGLLLHRLAGATDRVVEMTVTRKSRTPDPNLILHYTSRNPFNYSQLRDGLPVTSVPRTLLDVAAVLKSWHLELALDDALRRGATSVSDMWSMLQRWGGRGCTGSKAIRRLLEERTDGRARSQSTFEIVTDELLRNSSLPPYFRQFEVMTKLGIPAFIDFAWPEARLGVEADSYKWHSGRQQWQSDMERQNALAEIGWLLLRFSWWDVTRRPNYVLETIASTLEARLLSAQ